MTSSSDLFRVGFIPIMSDSLELVVIVPVYNEEEAIVSVLEEWLQMLREQKLSFKILVINDGSTDDTQAKVETFQGAGGNEIICHRQVNQGHGQSCINGYRLAIKMGVPLVFQIDSDGQCEPAYFPEVWKHREEAAAIYGRRMQRDDGFGRVLVSWVLRYFLKILMGTKLNDTNVPYRLYKTELLRQQVDHVPKDFHLANIAMALLMEQYGFLEVPIGFRDRKGGDVNVKWWNFASRALQLRQNLKGIRPWLK
jgi:dolichol-phosphate mannosyltransferase